MNIYLIVILCLHLFRSIQGQSETQKLVVLKDAVQEGMEKAANKCDKASKMAFLKSHFLYITGVDTWENATKKFPDFTKSETLQPFLGNQQQNLFIYDYICHIFEKQVHKTGLLFGCLVCLFIYLFFSKSICSLLLFNA